MAHFNKKRGIAHQSHVADAARIKDSSFTAAVRGYRKHPLRWAQSGKKPSRAIGFFTAEETELGDGMSVGYGYRLVITQNEGNA